MANLSIRRNNKSKKQRAAGAASTAGSAAWTFLKARVAWVAGKKAAKVAVPAAAAGTAAVVAKKRFSRDATATPQPAPTGTAGGADSVPAAPPASVA
jgi:hypothetical protein